MNIDPQLHGIVDQVYRAYEAGSLILASIGLRTAFDRATFTLGIHPGHSLEEKVGALVDAGHIGSAEAASLRIVVGAGSAAAHRAWAPNAEEFRALLETLEQFLSRSMVSGNGVLSIAERIPLRTRRPKRPATD